MYRLFIEHKRIAAFIYRAYFYVQWLNHLVKSHKVNFLKRTIFKDFSFICVQKAHKFINNNHNYYLIQYMNIVNHNK